MKTLNIVLGLAVGAGICLLLTSDKGEELREDIADNLKDILKKMDHMTKQAGHGVKDLQKMVGKEMSGLSEDARKRIVDILEETGELADKTKRNVNKMMA